MAFTLFQIGDFGMSRDLGDSCYYKSGGGIVPVRWTAPEVGGDDENLSQRQQSTPPYDF